MKIILTGGAGFIGSCFLWKCNQMGIDKILLVDAHTENQSHSNLQKKYFTDFISRDDLLRLVNENKIDDYDGIIHLGACTDTTETNKDYLRENNTEYSQSMAKWAFSKNKIFQYASSASVYGDGSKGFDDLNDALLTMEPLNLYADSKFQFDKWLIENQLTSRCTGYRYFNVYGPNEYHKEEMKSLVAKAYYQIKETNTVRLFAASRPGDEDGSEKRDFIYVKDVCDVMAYFLENPAIGGIYNVGTGEARAFKELAEAVFLALKKKPQINYFPMPDKYKRRYQYFTEAKVDKLRNAGYKKSFTKMESAVEDYVVNYLSNPNPYL